MTSIYYDWKYLDGLRGSRAYFLEELIFVDSSIIYILNLCSYRITIASSFWNNTDCIHCFRFQYLMFRNNNTMKITHLKFSSLKLGISFVAINYIYLSFCGFTPIFIYIYISYFSSLIFCCQNITTSSYMFQNSGLRYFE